MEVLLADGGGWSSTLSFAVAITLVVTVVDCGCCCCWSLGVLGVLVEVVVVVVKEVAEPHRLPLRTVELAVEFEFEATDSLRPEGLSRSEVGEGLDTEVLPF